MTLEEKLAMVEPLPFGMTRGCKRIENSFPFNILPDTPTVSNVHDLIFHETSQWDRDIVEQIFVPDDVNCILQIPIINKNMEDDWFWYPSANGIFSVKSCYKVMLNLKIQRDDSLNKFLPLQPLWKRLWKLSVPNKYKIFLWRLCHNIIPTVLALNSRGLQIQDSCFMCKYANESAAHVFMDCDEIAAVWGTSPFQFNLDSTDLCISEWLLENCKLWSDKQLGFFSMACYFIWEYRNASRIDTRRLHLGQIWKKCEDIWNGFNHANTIINTPHVPCWSKPAYPCFKINCDAATSNTFGGSVRCIGRDWHGVFSGAVSRVFPNIKDPLILEGLAMLEGIKFAKHLRLSDIVLKSDSKMVMEVLGSNCVDLSYLVSIKTEILSLCRELRSVCFIWCHRKANMVAHCVAPLGRNSVDSFVCWMDSPPTPLAHVLSAELSA